LHTWARRTDIGRTGKEMVMAGKAEQIKGQTKQAVGSLIGDKDLESEGKADRRAGETKEKVRRIKDKAEALLEGLEDKAATVIDRAKDSSHRK
jgi:uncharacterized protein YjbJ (UPF0337 family)